MTVVLGGSAALAAVVAVGWLTARTGVLGTDATGEFSRLSFYVATPALLLLTLAEAHPGAILTAAQLATGGSALLSGLLYAGLARWWYRLRPGELDVLAASSPARMPGWPAGWPSWSLDGHRPQPGSRHAGRHRHARPRRAGWSSCWTRRG